jgi:hypothetical protein
MSVSSRVSVSAMRLWCRVDHAGMIATGSYRAPNAAGPPTYRGIAGVALRRHARRKWPVSTRAYHPSMPKPSFADTARAVESWAEVRARDQVMRYRRSGVGRAVLLFLIPDHREPLWPGLLEALGAGFRLIVPEPPAADADIAGWLADFLEGLGMSNVRILAADRFCLPALELALLEADQVARLVLLPEGTGGRGEVGATLETATRHMRVPLLVIRRGQPADEIVSLIKDFLGDGAAASA